MTQLMIDNDLESLKAADYSCVLHPASHIGALEKNGPFLIHKAKGCHITDSDQKRYLDAVAGLWCVNVGYGREEIAQIMKEAAGDLCYYPTFTNASNPAQISLAEKLLNLAPSHLSKVFFGSSGSDANDTLVKIAWHVHSLRGQPTKRKIIARHNAYHGTSISTASLTGIPAFHKHFPLPLDFVLRTTYPHHYSQGLPNESESAFTDRLIEEIEALILHEGADNIAAFIAEPIIAAGGVVPPPASYFPRLQQLLKQHHIFLIADEVVTGFGRLGHWFASPRFEIEPDMISTAKGLTSGYFPLSASFISDSIWQTLRQGADTVGGFYHGYTYSGHPVGAAVALANIQLIERENLLQQAREHGAYLHSELATAFANSPFVGEIRGEGLLAGVQIMRNADEKVFPDRKDKLPAKIVAACRKKGLIVRPLPSANTIAISPPLTISKAEINFLVQTLADSVEKVMTET